MFLYRIVAAKRIEFLYLQDDFKSSYERSSPPRGIERRALIIHRGISMFDTATQAAEVAARFTKLGRHIATIKLTPEAQMNYAQTLNKGHFTVWGDPLKLVKAINDILPVEKYLKETQ